MIESHIIELLTGSGLLGMTGVIGYFLKKQNEKIEGVDSKITNLQTNLRADVLNNKKEIIMMFQDICHERQLSCGKVQDVRLDGLHKEGKSICEKVNRIKEDRGEKWRNQERINDAVKILMNRKQDK